jgi:hypothetical protein
MIDFTKLQISILQKVDIFSDLESQLNNKIISIIPDFTLNYTSILIKFDKKILDIGKKIIIPKLSTKHDFDIVLIDNDKIIIKIKKSQQ